MIFEDPYYRGLAIDAILPGNGSPFERRFRDVHTLVAPHPPPHRPPPTARASPFAHFSTPPNPFERRFRDMHTALTTDPIADEPLRSGYTDPA